MSTEVLFPKIGFSMSEGTLGQWLVADGATARNKARRFGRVIGEWPLGLLYR